jgi:hypothetical protein
MIRPCVVKMLAYAAGVIAPPERGKTILPTTGTSAPG